VPDVAADRVVERPVGLDVADVGDGRERAELVVDARRRIGCVIASGVRPKPARSG
jgi:hypothetical protein